MGDLIGMDADAVRRLAAQLDTHANALSAAMSSLDGLVQHLSQSWHGADAQEFGGWWYQQHRPALDRAIEAIGGLARSADNNAQQQDAASGATGESSTASTLWGRAERLGHEVGPVAGIAAGLIPSLAKKIEPLSDEDEEFRFLQDVGSGHYQDAFDQASDFATEKLVGAEHSTPLTFWAGANVAIWSDVERAGRNIDWSYQLSHMSDLNPLAPGAASAYGHAAVQGVSMVTNQLLGAKGGTAALAKIPLNLAGDAVAAAHGVDWSYTFSHLSQLNPIAPGAPAAIGGAAKEALHDVLGAAD